MREHTPDAFKTAQNLAVLFTNMYKVEQIRVAAKNVRAASENCKVLSRPEPPAPEKIDG